MVSLCIVKGEYDECLKWPLQGKAIILLLNSQQDDKHREAVYNFNTTRYDHPVHSTTDNPAQGFKCRNKKDVQHFTDNLRKSITAKLFLTSEVGPSHDSHHNQCKPVESAESVKFSFDKNGYGNNDDGSYFKGDHIYFKVTIEINSIST